MGEETTSGARARLRADLSDGDAGVRVVDLDDPDLEAAQPNDVDQADAGERRGEVRARFLRRRGALRAFVGSRLGLAVALVAIGYDRNGAPRLVEPGDRGFVSVSGRGPFAAFAFAPRPVGIDMEPRDPGVEPLFDTLSNLEAECLRRLSAPGRAVTFLKHWTAKEAYLKALGIGLTRDPASVTVTWPAPDRFTIRDGGGEAPGFGRSLEARDGVIPLLVSVFVLDAR